MYNAISTVYVDALLQKKLPEEFFEKQNIWLYRGNMYRLLVEPSDIANHYGLKSMSGVGHYLEGNRPGRYRRLQQRTIAYGEKSLEHCLLAA